ncbi:retroviral-like aspartic protease family protein [Rhizobium mayense]|uniref:Retroviral-like aspartic protease family protein n=1 Tax=Rhizobium mayense TaxID=1312184 RepID=A0ABT7JW89_9HYPH|nr:retroviral-like aspartic protease family protein [Rhizobium mayense]MDL2400619.1 retroviral-like aspartic protease family protein [Rhizobium mayense]
MLIADPEDRNAGRLPSRKGLFAPIFRTVTICIALCAGIAFYIYGDRIIGYVEKMVAAKPDPALLAIYKQYDIEPLPNVVAGRNPMSTYLDMLRREPCDWNALYKFGMELQAQGYRHEAATALVAFSNKCTPSNVALQSAASILLNLSEFDQAQKVADDLIAMTPGVPDYHFLRAQIRQGAKKYRDAIGDYYSVIGLTDNVANLNSLTYQGISDSYRALGDYCAALTPLQSWISINPDRNDTSVVRGIIKNYAAQGKCTSTYAAGSDRFPTQGKDVIVAKVSINGVSGNFVVDTGAGFVSVTKAFASRAKLPVDSANDILLQTANGVSQGTRASAATVKVGRVEANDVATVILNDDMALGSAIDGLLGRSFLSRFDVTFGTHEWRIETKE